MSAIFQKRVRTNFVFFRKDVYIMFFYVSLMKNLNSKQEKNKLKIQFFALDILNLLINFKIILLMLHLKINCSQKNKTKHFYTKFYVPFVVVNF